MIVLDTNVVSELTKDVPDANVLRWLDHLDPSDVWITSVVAAELYFGVETRSPGRETDRLRNTINAIIDEELHGRILPLDLPGAVAYAQIRAAQQRAGRQMALGDALIAGVCLSFGATLATRDRDFIGTGVELIDPWTVAIPG